MQTILGLDIGGTKTSVVLAEYHDGPRIEFIDKTVFGTDANSGVRSVLEHIFGQIDGMLMRNGVKEFVAGIACGGPLDIENGTILSPPNLIGWDNVNIVAMMRGRYGVRAFLQNDANACALAEWMMGAGKGLENVAFLTFGTGLGAGLILNNRLYCGSNGMAGEVGHIRLERMGPTGYGKSGSFEGFCSGNGISQLARSIALEHLQAGKKVGFCPDADGLNGITAKTVFDAAKNGDAAALEIVKTCGNYLGRGLSVIIDILNPQMIILGSIYVHNHDLLYPHVYAAIQKEAIHRSADVCRIVPAMLGERLGDYACVTSAVYGQGRIQPC